MPVCVGPRLSWNINPGPPGTMSSRCDQSPASAMKPLSLAHSVSFYPLLLCSYPPPNPTPLHLSSPHRVQEAETQIRTYMDGLTTR